MVISSCGGVAKSTPLPVQVKTRSADDDSEGDLEGSNVIEKETSVGAIVLEGSLELSVGVGVEGFLVVSVGVSVLDGFLVNGAELGERLGVSVK